ncbi:MAG TPA: GNAT family N-acetyltransferase [Pyrinomonadaceae bacterium]
MPEQFIESNRAERAGEITLRLLAASDVPAAMRLKRQANWNQTPDDWRRLIDLEPDGSFAAVSGERVVGTVTTTRYERDLAWIGMVLVDVDFRRRGIATALMTRALEFLDARRVRAIKLDATGEGAFVYENLGFVAESTIERWSRRAAENAVREPKISSTANDTEFSETKILEFDRRHFGADRAPLLKKLIDEASFAPLVVGAGVNIGGYALARRGARADYLGPLVAENARAAEKLLDGALLLLTGDEIYIDANARFEGFERILTARGFVKQRELVRMRRGAQTGAASAPTIFAIAGLEVG